MSEKFTIDEGVAVQKRLRSQLGLGEATVDAEGLVRMLTDEIAAMREAGREDAEIKAVIKDVTGKSVPASAIARSGKR